MLLRNLFAAFLVIVSTEADLNCPLNYNYDTAYGCLSVQPSVPNNGFRSTGYADCANSYAYFFRIKNSFDNTAFMQRCTESYYRNCWLGITCNSTDVSSCQYDNGDRVKYSNFATGRPGTNGSCVYFNKVNGLWYSDNCFAVHSYVCQIDQTMTPLSCGSSYYNTFYRGKCYYNNQTQSISDAERYCKENGGGDLVSIHSESQNQLYYQYLWNGNQQYLYSYLGLQASGQNFTWNDFSPYNYNNFAPQAPTLGTCTLMSTAAASPSSSLLPGQWFTYPCSLSNTNVGSVCVKDTLPSPADPITPILCDTQTPFFGNSSGTINSPGFPRMALNGIQCQYDIFDPSGANATVTVSYSFQNGGSMYFYDSLIPGSNYFYAIRTYGGTQTVTSSTSMMRVAFTAGSSGSYFVLWYGQQ